VINTGYEIVFKALYATKLLKTLAHRHFKNVVCFLNLADVNFLKLNKFLVYTLFTYICHLQKPIEDYFFLVQRKLFLQLVEERFGP
jgi:hypothetical protein